MEKIRQDLFLEHLSEPKLNQFLLYNRPHLPIQSQNKEILE